MVRQLPSLFNLDVNQFATYYRRTLNDTEKADYISAVKCLQSRPAFEPRAVSAIQSRFDDFQALHIQVADRVHLTVSTNKYHDVNHKTTSEIALVGAILTLAQIFFTYLRKCAANRMWVQRGRSVSAFFSS
jgi:hypothetical protein